MAIKHSNDFMKSSSRATFNQGNTFGQRLVIAALNLFENPWTAALIAGAVFLLFSARSGAIKHASDVAYYNYLADAFLHGQTWLRIIPPTTFDLSFFQDHYYLYWGPFPAILLMPFVAIFGVQLNDVLYTCLIAALNIGLVAQLLRSTCTVGLLRLSKTQRAILVFFIAFGTVHFPLAPYGKVWFTGQLIGFTCVLVAYILALSRNDAKGWFFTGLALACAMLSRIQMVFTGIFPLIYLIYRNKSQGMGSLFRKIAWAAFPLLVAMQFYLLYNQARFQNPLQVGMVYQNMSVFFRPDFERYGVSNLHYVPINLYYQYIYYPLPISSETGMGGSLFLLSPLFFGVFGIFWKRNSKLFLWALLASILVTNIPILLNIGTGYLFFGPRYTLDFTVPLLLLTAMGIENLKPEISFILAIVSSFQYLIGTIALG